MVDERYLKIANAFNLPGIPVESGRLGNGHINETVLMVFDDNGVKYRRRYAFFYKLFIFSVT